MTREQKIWILEMELAMYKSHLSLLKMHIEALKWALGERNRLQSTNTVIKCQDGSEFKVEG